VAVPTKITRSGPGLPRWQGPACGG